MGRADGREGVPGGGARPGPVCRRAVPGGQVSGRGCGDGHGILLLAGAPVPGGGMVHGQADGGEPIPPTGEVRGPDGPRRAPVQGGLHTGGGVQDHEPDWEQCGVPHRRRVPAVRG